VFISRELKENLNWRIRKEKFEVFSLPTKSHFAPTFNTKTSEYIRWLETDWKTDANETLQALKSIQPDWLVVDHYGLDIKWETRLRAFCGMMMVIDDLADRDHNCDLLLDQNLIADLETRYQKRVSSNCSMLLGNNYALLQRIYSELHPCAPPRRKPIRRIMCFFGGAEHQQLAIRAVEAFIDLSFPNLLLDVVIGPVCSDAAHLRAKIKRSRNISIHENLPSLAHLMLKADLAIGGGGSASWERCCLGLPTLVITVANNQIAIAREMNRKRLIRWIGHHDNVSAKTIATALRKVLSNQDSLADWSTRCWESIDGTGAARVAEILMLCANTPLKARKAELSDEGMLLSWAKQSSRNLKTPKTKNLIRDFNRIAFYKYLRESEKINFFIVETMTGLPVGVVIFQFKETAWEMENILIPKEVEKTIIYSNLLKKAIQELRKNVEGQNLPSSIRLKNKWIQQAQKNYLFSYKNKTARKLFISICSDGKSWINDHIPSLLINFLFMGHQAEWLHDAKKLRGGTLCFFLGYSRIVDQEILAKYKNNLVVHESNLPKGRGWSPLTWQIIEGKNKIPITLIEAAKEVDSGRIYNKKWLFLNGNELIPEIRKKQAETTFELCREFVKKYPNSATTSKPQKGTATFYCRRRPENNKINPSKSIKEIFNLLRTADNERYPAFFNLKGKRFNILLETAL